MHPKGRQTCCTRASAPVKQLRFLCVALRNERARRVTQSLLLWGSPAFLIGDWIMLGSAKGEREGGWTSVSPTQEIYPAWVTVGYVICCLRGSLAWASVLRYKRKKKGTRLSRTRWWWILFESIVPSDSMKLSSWVIKLLFASFHLKASEQIVRRRVGGAACLSTSTLSGTLMEPKSDVSPRLQGQCLVPQEFPKNKKTENIWWGGRMQRECEIIHQLHEDVDSRHQLVWLVLCFNRIDIEYHIYHVMKIKAAFVPDIHIRNI